MFLVADEAEHLMLLQVEQLARDRVSVARSATESVCFGVIEASCRRLRAKNEALSPGNRAAQERLVLDLSVRRLA